MAKTTKEYLNEAGAFNSKGIITQTNAPAEYSDRQKQYLGDRTRAFVNNRAYLSSDYFAAETQGLNPNDFYEWSKTHVRLSDVTSGIGTEKRRDDDFKIALFPDKSIDYFPLGAKVNVMGSIWLCINPSNISSVNANALLVRCNSSYNSYDSYGNIITEPLYIESPHALYANNELSKNQNLMLAGADYKVTCQLNDNTKRLGLNQRIIVGTKPYHITGFNDFIQEFTGVRESVHLLTFTMHLDEPDKDDDVSENFIANGYSYSFAAEITGTTLINGSANYEAHFLINGSVSAELPLSWSFMSSDTNVLTVDENGFATAHGAGTAVITAYLYQNPNVSASINVEVADTQNPVARFAGVVPANLTQYSSITLIPILYINGAETDANWNYTFSGAKSTDYSVSISPDTSSVVITCLNPSDSPLTIEAICISNEVECAVSTNIKLLGY